MNGEAKLVIETAAPAANPTSTPVSTSIPTTVDPPKADAPPKATTPPPVQNNPVSYPEVDRNPQSTNPTSSQPFVPTIGGKKSLLAVLQQKYGNDYNIEEVKDAISLNLETLQACWDDYAVKMEKELKHSVAGTFRIATLQIEDPTHFTITVPALTAQKFVEQERMRLMETIWERFQNRAIQFSILVDAGEKEDVPLHLKLNSKQKFDHIAKQYPLVQELKERLNLEVNF